MPRVPQRYIPKNLSKKDKKKLKKELKKSRKAYKKGQYHTRKKVKSFKSRTSNHVLNAKKIYGVDKISANPILARKTGCSIDALRKIVKKGQGAYFSSGSRPNQTAHSWGRARLASAISGGKASAVDLKILMNGCKKTSKALKLAKKTKKYGQRRVPKIKIGGQVSNYESCKNAGPDPINMGCQRCCNKFPLNYKPCINLCMRSG